MEKEIPMFLEKNRDRIRKEFEKFCLELPEAAGEIREKISSLDENTALAMEYFYGNMPYSDVGNYATDVFLDYARQGVYLWENSPFCKNMPEEVFLQDVLFYRVNEEEIKPCRKLFYEKIADRIAGMDMKNSILEVNYWCAEEVTYQASDERTSSALDVWRKGFGRCGEESVFAVNALRSVGIPARQVYAPFWAHCDDNHAWVEVWCDGKWHYLGACEPEAILDKGWFTNASSRAMMVHSRCFESGETEGQDVGREGITMLKNQLSRYASTKKITIRVEKQDGTPAEGASIQAEVLNYSEFCPIAKMISGPDGRAELETGLGSLHIFAAFQGEFGECLIDTRKEDCCVCVLGEEKTEEVWEDFDMIAPSDSIKETPCASREAEEENNRRVAEAAELRKKKAEAFCPRWIKEFLPGEPEKAAEYMAVLSEKDRQDADPEVLKEHYELAKVYADQYPKELFLSYVWNPRVSFEILSRWRRDIQEYFSLGQQETFRRAPETIWSWIQSHLKSRTDRERVSVYTTPGAALRTGYAEMESRKVLFVAIARTLGIPARMNQVDGSLEYWKDGDFVRVVKEQEKNAHLTFKGDDGADWIYFQNWSLAKLEKDGYHSLKLWNVRLDEGNLKLDVEPGKYRLLTANRLPTGNIFAKRYDFSVEAGESRQITLSMRQASLKDMLDRHSIPDYDLTDENGQKHSVGELTEKGRRILCWLEVSKEPTEHILNELMEMQDAFALCQDNLAFIVKGAHDLTDPTLSKCRKALPKVKIYFDTFGKDQEMTARRMYVDPGKLPLLVVTDGKASGIFAAGGYSVGMAAMLMRVLRS